MNKFAEAKIISVHYKCETSDEFGVDTKGIKNKLNKINEEKDAAKNRKVFYSKKRKSNIFSGSVGKVIITALMAASVAAFLRLDATTIREKQFFEVEYDGSNSMKITVTGNEGVDNGIVSYATWDILQLAHPDIRIPQYIPSKVEIEELYRQTQDGYTLYFGDYSKGLSIKILSYSGDAATDTLSNDWALKETENGISYYKNGRECMAYWIDGQNVYNVIWNHMSEVKKIAESMLPE